MPRADWLTRTWAKEDPYEGLREKVVEEYRAAPNKRNWVAGLGRKWKEGRKAMFRYLAASYLLLQDDPDYCLAEAYRVSTNLYEPTSREAARARFLISSDYDWSPALRKVGERLLAGHEEFAVRYYLTRMLVTGIDFSKDRYAEALQAAKRLVAIYPDHGKVHALLGGVYYCGFKQLHIKGDRDRTISEFRLFLASNPPNSAAVRRLPSEIEKLEAAR